MWIALQFDSLENSLLQVAVNPVLKRIVRLIDKDCPKDGNLLLNSLRDFLGEPISLCPTCKSVSTKLARHFYGLGSSFLRVDKDFMRNQFLKDKFRESWFRGFGLMLKGGGEIWRTHTVHASRTLRNRLERYLSMQPQMQTLLRERWPETPRTIH